MRTSNSESWRIGFTALMVVVYLTVFLAHDIVYGERIGGPAGTQNTGAPLISDFSNDHTVSCLEHHCPFCFGFVDTHVAPSDNVSEETVSFVGPPRHEAPERMLYLDREIQRSPLRPNLIPIR